MLVKFAHFLFPVKNKRKKSLTEFRSSIDKSKIKRNEINWYLLRPCLWATEIVEYEGHDRSHHHRLTRWLELLVMYSEIVQKC